MREKDRKLRGQSGRLVRWWSAVLAAGAFHFFADVAMAQKRANLPDDEGFVIRYGVLAAVVVVIGLTAFLNPKRTHLS